VGEYAERRQAEEAELERKRHVDLDETLEEAKKRGRLLELEIRQAEARTKEAESIANEAAAKAESAKAQAEEAAAKAKEAEAKEAEAKAEEAQTSASARKQSAALQHYTETQLATVSRVQTAVQALSACASILGPIDEATKRRAKDTIVTIATSHPRVDEDLGAPIRLVQFLMEEAPCDEAWAFEKVSVFGRYAKQVIQKDYPVLVLQQTTVHFRGRSCDSWQYYEAQRPTLRRALQVFLRQHRPPAPRDQGIARFAVSPASAA
jgi:flagellar biosynthesis GTPase FlhF